ncbi:uncharacterized protein LOC144926173 isoform X2 [Branchiostoma floridae x Branchiostoma belcheri]
MPRTKQTVKGRRPQTDLEETPEASQECPASALAGAQIQNYSPTQAADVEVKIHSERRHTPTSDARTDEAVKLTVEETVTEECCVSAETGPVKKRKLEETSEAVKKSRASMEVTDVTQPESQTDRPLAEPEDSQSQQAGQRETENALKCYAQDTMNELLGMFGYDGVDEEEASNLHVSSSFVPPPPPPPPDPQSAPTPTQPAETETPPGQCTWCKKTFKGEALKFVLKLPGETQAYCSTECVTQGKSAYISNTAAGSHRLSQALPREAKKKGKYSAQDAMNELIGMYMCDGGEEDETSNLQKNSRLSPSSPGVLNRNPSPTDEQETIADTTEGCMLCKVKTKALDFVLKLPDGTHQAYCSGLCLARGKALMKKMSSRSSRPFSSHRLRSSTQVGNKAAHKQQCAGSSHQTKLEIKQKLTRSRALKPAETQEDEEKTGISCCMWCNKTAAELDFVLKMPDGKLHTYCSVECLSKGKKVQARRTNSCTTSQPLSCTQDKTLPTRNGNKVFSKDQGTESLGQNKRTKSKNSCIFWLCHNCKKTISGDRIISTDGGKFCSEICVRRHKIMLQ